MSVLDDTITRPQTPTVPGQGTPPPSTLPLSGADNPVGRPPGMIPPPPPGGGTGTPTPTPPPAAGAPVAYTGTFAGPTYQDYYRIASGMGGSDAGTPAVIPEAQWNAMSLDQRLANMPSGGGLTIDANDPRYAELAPLTGAEPGRPIEVVAGKFDPNMRDAKGNLIIQDPSKVVQGNGWWAYASNNQTSGSQAAIADSGIFHGDRWDGVKAAAWIGAGMLGGGALAGLADGGAGVAGLDALPALEPTIVGDLGPAFALPETAGGAAATLPATADGLTAGINTSIDTALLPPIESSPVLNAALPEAPDFLGGAAAGVPGAGAPGPDGTLPFDTSTTPPQVLNPTMQPPPNVDIPPPEVPGGGGSVADRILGRIGDDPIRALGTAATVGSLFNRPSGSGAPSDLRNIVDANKPIADDSRNTLLNHGAPSKDQRATIDAGIQQQWKMGREAILQASINSGMGGNNSMVVQDKLRAFGEQLEVMRQQLYMKQAEQNMVNALKELGMITEEQFALAKIELQQDTNAQQRATSIMQSLGWLWSMSSPGSSGSGH